jgi:hypothetical protein
MRSVVAPHGVDGYQRHAQLRRRSDFASVVGATHFTRPVGSVR